MRLELAERLRCPSSHAAAPLVVWARKTRDRELIEGLAGCPVCRLEIPFEDGHLRFDGSVLPPAQQATADVDRVIALLGLAEPSGTVLLTGGYAAVADAVAEMAGVQVVVMLADEAPAASDRVSAILGVPPRLPFADLTFVGAALDASTPRSFVDDVVRTVVMRGRVLAAATHALPPDLKELARDDREWVATRENVTSVAELRRRT